MPLLSATRGRSTFAVAYIISFTENAVVVRHTRKIYFRCGIYHSIHRKCRCCPPHEEDLLSLWHISYHSPKMPLLSATRGRSTFAVAYIIAFTENAVVVRHTRKTSPLPNYKEIFMSWRTNST